MELAPNPRDHTEEGSPISLTSSATRQGLREAIVNRRLREIDELSAALPDDAQIENGLARVHRTGQITEIWLDKEVIEDTEDSGTTVELRERHIIIENCDQTSPGSTVLWVADTPYAASGRLATESRSLQCLLPGQPNPEFPLDETLDDIGWVRDHIPAEELISA
jgi:hypothetical protein